MPSWVTAPSHEWPELSDGCFRRAAAVYDAKTEASGFARVRAFGNDRLACGRGPSRRTSPEGVAAVFPRPRRCPTALLPSGRENGSVGASASPGRPRSCAPRSAGASRPGGRPSPGRSWARTLLAALAGQHPKRRQTARPSPPATRASRVCRPGPRKGIIRPSRPPALAQMALNHVLFCARASRPPNRRHHFTPHSTISGRGVLINKSEKRWISLSLL